jgi:hypothetical protein
MEQFDLIRAINKLRKRCPVTTTLKHVKGHQDDNENFYQLDRWAQLNVMADTMAKRKLTDAMNNDEFHEKRTSSFPLDQCSISFCDAQKVPQEAIQGNLLKSIRREAGQVRIRRYWRKKGIIHEATEKYIDWKVVHKSHKALDPLRHRWLSKWMTGFCGVGKMMKIYKFQQHSKCPKCQQNNETTDHVLQCQSYGTHCLWQKLMRELTAWIVDNDGPPSLGKVLTQNLTAWRQKSIFPPPPQECMLRQAILQQDELGWGNLLKGFIGIQWRMAVEQHFLSIKSQKSSVVWISKLIRKIWDLQRQLWDDRNNTLHGEGQTIHLEELNAINEELTKQWMAGLNQLPLRYRHLFQGEFRTLYQANIHHKQQWLTSVWLAREKHSPLHMTRNAIAETFYLRWHRRVNQPPADLTPETPHPTEPPSATLPDEEPPELDSPPAEPPD